MLLSHVAPCRQLYVDYLLSSTVVCLWETNDVRIRKGQIIVGTEFNRPSDGAINLDAALT
jgi:hypothetical protein